MTAFTRLGPGGYPVAVVAPAPSAASVQSLQLRRYRGELWPELPIFRPTRRFAPPDQTPAPDVPGLRPSPYRPDLWAESIAPAARRRFAPLFVAPTPDFDQVGTPPRPFRLDLFPQMAIHRAIRKITPPVSAFPGKARASQLVTETVAFAEPSARASQLVAETGAFGTPTARASQLVTETGAFGDASARASQLVTETGAFGQPRVRASQLVIEILVLNREIPLPVVYPTLPGLTFNVVWRPKAINFAPQVHSSGREVRIGAAEYPLHEFELTYELLRGRPTEIEFKTYLGFFLSLNGSLNGFNFLNKHDNKVIGQAFVTTDGINSQFGPLVRTIGANGFTGDEPVGYVDTTQPFNLYRDGILIDPSDATWAYTVETTQPVNQLVKFNNTPPADAVLTVDMSYFYYCRFADDSLDFNEFMHQLWELKNPVKLMSLRG